MEGQEMLPTMQLCPELSMSQHLGTISMAHDRREAETGHLISWTQSSISRQSQEEDWQGQFNNIMKTNKNQESRARQVDI